MLENEQADSINMTSPDIGEGQSQLVHRKRRKRADSMSALPNSAGQPSLEERMLYRMDEFLGSMETKLDFLQRYVERSSDPSSSSFKEKLMPSPQLLEVWKKTKESVIDSYTYSKETAANPLLAVLNGMEKKKLNDSKQIEPTDNRIGTDGSINISSFQQQFPSSVSSQYNRIMDRLRKLDLQMDTFEKTYGLMPQNPQQTLRKLRSSLYNYEKALVAGSHRLLHFYELPFQWRENRYIVFGYRFSKSHSSAVRSIFHLHNETANIWTHLLGALLIFGLAVWHYPNTRVYQLSSWGDRLVTFTFLAAAIKCLLFSVVWHTFANISTLHLRQRFACFDYSGITILIIASIMTTEHISLRDYWTLRLGFVLFSFLAGVAGVLFSCSPHFDKPDSRVLRIGFFIGLATLGIMAFITSSFLKGFMYTLNLYSPLFVSFAGYLIGVVFYGCLIPERWRSDVVIDNFQITDESILDLDRKGKLQSYLNKQPEKTGQRKSLFSLWWVDYIFSSHNLWHLFVIFGILGHYFATLKMFQTILE